MRRAERWGSKQARGSYGVIGTAAAGDAGESVLGGGPRARRRAGRGIAQRRGRVRRGVRERCVRAPGDLWSGERCARARVGELSSVRVPPLYACVPVGCVRVLCARARIRTDAAFRHLGGSNRGQGLRPLAARRRRSSGGGGVMADTVKNPIRKSAQDAIVSKLVLPSSFIFLHGAAAAHRLPARTAPV